MERFLPFLLLALGISGYVVKYFLNAFLANHMTEEFYGNFSVALRTLDIAATTVLLGTNISAIRYLSQYIIKKDQQLVKSYISWNFHLMKYSFTAMLIIALLAVFSIFMLHLLGVKGLGEHHLAIYILCITPLVSMVMLFSSYLLSNNHSILSTFLNEAAKYLLILGFFTVTILLMQIPLNDIHVISVLLVVFILLFMYEFFLMVKIKFIPKNVFKPFKDIKFLQQSWLRPSLELFIYNISFLIICAIDLFVVEVISPNESDVGFYAAAITIGGCIWLIPDNVYTFIKPKISSMIRNYNKKVFLQKLLNTTNVIMFIIVGIAASFIIIFSKFLLQSFGKTYFVIQPVLIILVLGYCIGALSKSPAILMAYGGEENKLLKITFFELGFAIVVTVLLTYFFGLIGTAVSTSMTLVVRIIPMLWAIRTKFHIKSILIL